MSRVNVLRSAGLGLTVVVLVGGALLIGQEAADPAADARETLRSYYSTGNAAAVADRIVPGSLGQDVPREQLETSLAQVLQEPFEVEDTSTHQIRGTEVVRVALARPEGPPLEWCVLPDGGLLVGCRVASSQLSGEVQGAPLTLDFSAIDILASSAQLAVVLTPSGQEEVPIEGEVRLRGDSFELVNTAYLLGGQQVPADPQDLRARPGAGLLLLWRADQVEDVTTYAQGPFTLDWGEGSVELTVDQVTWFVGDDAAPAPSPS